MDRTGKQNIWPRGGCRKDLWHEQMDSFLIAYYVANRHGNLGYRSQSIASQAFQDTGCLFGGAFSSQCRNDKRPPKITMHDYHQPEYPPVYMGRP